jgi:hypothetical protein
MTNLLLHPLNPLLPLKRRSRNLLSKPKLIKVRAVVKGMWCRNVPSENVVLVGCQRTVSYCSYGVSISYHFHFIVGLCRVFWRVSLTCDFSNIIVLSQEN